MTPTVRRLVLLLTILFAVVTMARSEWRQGVGRGEEGEEGRKYAPDRLIDVLLVRIEITPDFDRRSIEAVTHIEFRPIAEAAAEIALDAVDLAVSSIESSQEIEGYTVGEEQIVITFAEPIPAGEDASVSVSYTAEPKKDCTSAPLRWATQKKTRSSGRKGRPTRRGTGSLASTTLTSGSSRR